MGLYKTFRILIFNGRLKIIEHMKQVAVGCCKRCKLFTKTTRCLIPTFINPAKIWIFADLFKIFSIFRVKCFLCVKCKVEVGEARKWLAALSWRYKLLNRKQKCLKTLSSRPTFTKPAIIRVSDYLYKTFSSLVFSLEWRA